MSYDPPPQQPYQGQLPYQAQPYPDPGYANGNGYGPQPDPDPGYGNGNGYGPQPPQRRRPRGAFRAILGAVGAVVGIVVVVAIVHAGNGDQSVTTGQAATAPSASTTASPLGLTKVGSVIILTGNSAGEQMAVSVVKVFRHPRPVDQFNAPQQGDRLYAVQFSLADIGGTPYSDSPSNGAAVVDAAGQSFPASLDDIAGCQSFPAAENIAAGGFRLGCIVFEVPATARITKAQFTLDSGMGPQTGQWNVSV